MPGAPDGAIARHFAKIDKSDRIAFSPAKV